jgi:hypothetical protein
MASPKLPHVRLADQLQAPGHLGVQQRLPAHIQEDHAQPVAVLDQLL